MSADVSNTCDVIRYLHRQRNYAMDQRKRADLALGSFLRMALGWRKDGPKDVNDHARTRAAKLIEIGEALEKQASKPAEKRKSVEGAEDPDFLEWRQVIEASILARAPFDKIEADMTRSMEKAAASLPVWEAWGKDVRGFGPRSLAVIVGEAGDLSLYPEKGHLWKRMGLAVIDGTAQGRPGKGASKEAWAARGYNPARRSRMYVIGDVLVKVGDEYRAVYLSRKEYERQRAEATGLTVAPTARIPKARADQFISDGVIHKRAQRYMEKRLLRDMWKAWRRATHGAPEGPTLALPSAEIQTEARS